jgi:hypothetical protein
MKIPEEIRDRIIASIVTEKNNMIISSSISHQIKLYDGQKYLIKDFEKLSDAEYFRSYVTSFYHKNGFFPVETWGYLQ